jgi:uncharacterized damage-inducible protein DinB
MLQLQVNYMIWADQEILHACSALSNEELYRDLGISHKSILGTLRHMFIAEYDWLVRLRFSLTRPDAEVDQALLYAGPVSGPNFTELRAQWASVWPGWREYVESLAESAFEEEFLAMETRIPRWKLIQHVVNHATLHRGQVAGMLRQLGKQPPCTDLFEFHKVGERAV